MRESALATLKPRSPLPGRSESLTHSAIEAMSAPSVSIASFAQRGNAEAMLKKLRAFDRAPQIEHDAARGLYRVVIVDVPSEEVDRVRAHLAALGHANVLIRRD